MRTRATLRALLIVTAAAVPAHTQVVGPSGQGTVVTTAQLVRPAGRTVEWNGRPVDIALAPGGNAVYAKDNRGLVVIDPATWTVRQHVRFPTERGGSMTGLAVRADGAVLATDSKRSLLVFAPDDRGTVTHSATIDLPPGDGAPSAEVSFPCGIALLPGGAQALVALSSANELALVDLGSGGEGGGGGSVVRRYPVGIAPFAVAVSADGRTAYASCWGGRRPREGEAAEPSAGTPVLVDPRGVAASGGLSIVDLAGAEEPAFVETGLSASGLVRSPDGSRVYVANANADTVTVIDTGTRRVVAQTVVRAQADLPFGSMPNGLAITPDGATLFAACAGHNAVGVLDTAAMERGEPAIRGWIPAGWYPGALLLDGDALVIANIKGVGSRTPRDADGALNSHRHRGSVQRVTLPDPQALAVMTAQAIADARVPEALRAIDLGARAAEQPPAPVPASVGAPSVFRHVLYVIKENRTYDQVFGALAAGQAPRGRGDPRLCIYGRDVTPNQHALAEQFVLLDNFYCNGVLSADGHSWATEGNVTPYLERSFGGFARSYTFGDDPLTYSASGFLWDRALAAGLSFRNYGEFNDSGVEGDRRWIDVYRDWAGGARTIRFTTSIGVANLRRYSHPASPGWNMQIPDQVRADAFIEDFTRRDEAGEVPSLMLLYLPQNHTMGLTEGGPTPRACVADNDLALGRVVEAVTRSRAWAQTCIFVVEDDPQDGWDHVDGHRSIALVVSPWTKRGAVVSSFYSQASVVHTIDRIFGIAAANAVYAAAPLMTDCFVQPGAPPDLTPFHAVPARIPLDELTPPRSASGPCVRPWYDATAAQDFSRPDAADEDAFNRVHWHAARGCEPYPAHVAGAHGAGLAARGLRLVPRVGVDEDDDGTGPDPAAGRDAAP